MPLGIKKVRNPIWQKKDTDAKKAALRLIQFEKTLYSDKINNKRKRDEQIVKYDANTNSDVEPPKKQKKHNLTHDKLDLKSEFSENRGKLKTKNLSKEGKASKKIKLNCTNDTNCTNCTNDEWQVSELTDQYTLPTPIAQNNTSIKKIAKKSITKKTILENSITQKNQVVALKNVSISLLK